MVCVRNTPFTSEKNDMRVILDNMSMPLTHPERRSILFASGYSNILIGHMVWVYLFLHNWVWHPKI